MSYFAVTTIYDIQNPESEHSVVSLLLMLDEPVEYQLPNGEYVTGILREVNPKSDRLIELVVQIPAKFESLFYVNHNPLQTDLIHRNN